MKITSRDINLIIGIFALIILISFIFLGFKPKYEIYQELKSDIDPYRQKYEEAKMLVQEVPEYEEYVKQFEEQRQKLEEIIPYEVSDTETLATIEYIAEETKIDLKTLKEVGDGGDQEGQGNTPEGQQNPQGQNGEGQNQGQQPQGQTSSLSYELEIRGEYRSIMMFLFKIQNLEKIVDVQDFVLQHNQGYNADKDPDSSYPLSAKFKLVFLSKNGGAY